MSEPVHRSAVTHARRHLSWKAFEQMHSDAVDTFYNIRQANEFSLWKGFNVFAIDGSKHLLPATKELRSTFNPKSGLGLPGKGHYPQCLVSTVYDVMNKIPVALSVDHIRSNERDIAVSMLPKIPSNGILVLDRGYPSYEVLHNIITGYQGHFLLRCQQKNSFKAVTDFLNSGRKEAIAIINPSLHFLRSIPKEKRKDYPPLTIRLVRYKAKDGSLSALITDLLDFKEYSRKEILDLYSKRWGVETYYRNSKTVLKIEQFHSKSANGILQEFYALATMMVIAQLMISTAAPESVLTDKCKIRPQEKHAIKVLGKRIQFLIENDPASTFALLLQLISRVRFYQLRRRRKTQPRISKSAPSKWTTKARLSNAS